MTDKQNIPQENDFIGEIAQEADHDLHPFLKKILDNMQPIAIGIGAIILVVGGYTGYTSYAKNQTVKLNNELGTILTMDDSAKQIPSLHEFIEKNPSFMSVGTLMELANAEMKNKNYQEAADAWAKVAAQTDKDIKILALMGQARALSLQKKYKDALAILEGIDPLVGKDFATPLGRQIAFTAEQTGDWKKALAAYEGLKTDGAVTNTAFLDMKIAAIKAKMQG